MGGLEVEGKFPVECRMLERVEEAVRRLGGVLRGRLVETDVYLRHPCRDFLVTDEALRVRESGGRRVLTYKGPKLGGEVKSRLEVNVEIAGGDILGLLERLGFTPAIVVRKERSYYELGRFLVTLDRVEGLGCFVEIEGGEGLEGEILRLAERLGLDRGRIVFESYAEMLAGRLRGKKGGG